MAAKRERPLLAAEEHRPAAAPRAEVRLERRVREGAAVTLTRVGLPVPAAEALRQMVAAEALRRAVAADPGAAECLCHVRTSKT